MRITQGAFSYLNDLSDEEIAEQVTYALGRGWPISIEHTDDPHPRSTYWRMFGQPMFDVQQADLVIEQVRRCREEEPDHYVRLTAFDAAYGRQTTALSFIVHRPAAEVRYGLVRTEGPGRVQRYAVQRLR
jgi:ribulose-bisphosphate carboxylase small chain